MGTWECSICGKKWESDGPDCLRINDEPVCQDCYYSSLGKLIDTPYPTGIPKIRKKKGRKQK